MEAIWRIEVENFPAFIVIDDKGNDFFKELNLGLGQRGVSIGLVLRSKRSMRLEG